MVNCFVGTARLSPTVVELLERQKQVYSLSTISKLNMPFKYSKDTNAFQNVLRIQQRICQYDVFRFGKLNKFNHRNYVILGFNGYCKLWTITIEWDQTPSAQRIEITTSADESTFSWPKFCNSISNLLSNCVQKFLHNFPYHAAMLCTFKQETLLDVLFLDKYDVSIMMLLMEHALVFAFNSPSVKSRLSSSKHISNNKWTAFPYL